MTTTEIILIVLAMFLCAISYLIGSAAGYDQGLNDCVDQVREIVKEIIAESEDKE